MDALRELIERQEEAKRPLCDRVRIEALEAIALLVEAARRPLISRADILQANEHLKVAYAAAFELDPPFDGDDGKDDEYHPPVGGLTNHDFTDEGMPR